MRLQALEKNEQKAFKQISYKTVTFTKFGDLLTLSRLAPKCFVMKFCYDMRNDILCELVDEQAHLLECKPQLQLNDRD